MKLAACGLLLLTACAKDAAAPQAVNRSGGKAQLLGAPEPHVPADMAILPAAHWAVTTLA